MLAGPLQPVLYQPESAVEYTCHLWPSLLTHGCDSQPMLDSQ
jgi:hypothetical protein